MVTRHFCVSLSQVLGGDTSLLLSLSQVLGGDTSLLLSLSQVLGGDTSLLLSLSQVLGGDTSLLLSAVSCVQRADQLATGGPQPAHQRTGPSLGEMKSYT